MISYFHPDISYWIPREREREKHKIIIKHCPWLNLTPPKKTHTKSFFFPLILSGGRQKSRGKRKPFPAISAFPAIPSPRVDFPSCRQCRLDCPNLQIFDPLGIGIFNYSWGFQISFIFGPLFGEDFFFSLIIFRWVGSTTKQLSIHLSDPCSHVSSCFTDHVGK